MAKKIDVEGLSMYLHRPLCRVYAGADEDRKTGAPPAIFDLQRALIFPPRLHASNHRLCVVCTTYCILQAICWEVTT
jgi:hypothetical protein